MGDLAAAYPRGTRTRGNQCGPLGPRFRYETLDNLPSAARTSPSRQVFIMLAQETEPCGSVRLTRSLKHPRDARNNKGTPARQFQPRTLRRAGFIDCSDPAYLGPRLAPDAVDWSVLIVVVVIGVISVAAMIVPVIGH